MRLTRFSVSLIIILVDYGGTNYFIFINGVGFKKNCGAASVEEYDMKIIRFYQLNDDVNWSTLRVLKLTFRALALRQIYIRIYFALTKG